jgi:hypothetical protein
MSMRIGKDVQALLPTDRFVLTVHSATTIEGERTRRT